MIPPMDANTATITKAMIKDPEGFRFSLLLFLAVELLAEELGESVFLLSLLTALIKNNINL